MEAHVLAAISRRHGVKLPKVRIALNYVNRQPRVDRPLIDQSFHTDGLDLFVERYGDLINASREGQRAMKEIIGVYLKRIDWTPTVFPSSFIRSHGIRIRTQRRPADPRLVVMNPTISFGRRVIRSQI